MKTSLRKPIAFMYFCLNYIGKGHVKRTPVAVKNIGHLFHMASEIIEADRLHLFLLSDGTRIDNNKYLESLENRTELIVCTEEQMKKISIYLELKRYLSLKNISYPLDTDYFIWYLPTAVTDKTEWLLFNFDELRSFVEVVISSTYLSLVQSVFTYTLHIHILWTFTYTLNKQNIFSSLKLTL